MIYLRIQVRRSRGPTATAQRALGNRTRTVSLGIGQIAADKAC
jgi:hypothetical protein